MSAATVAGARVAGTRMAGIRSAHHLDGRQRPTAGCLLDVYAEHVGGLTVGPDAKRIRRRAAERLLARHPDLAAWMVRSTPARLADLRRSGAWPFVTWCFVEGYLTPDLDLLLAKTPGDLYAAWTARHPDDVARLAEVAAGFGWSALWTRDMTSGGLALLCLWAGKTLAELRDDDFARFAVELAAASSASVSAHSHIRHGCSACTRPAISSASARRHRGRSGCQRPRSPNGSAPSPSRSCAGWRSVTLRRWRPRCGRPPWSFGPTA
jgi:hypothetical protein